MTGPSERPSRPPRENRKAKSRPKQGFKASTYARERAAILLHYAAKIAAAELYASGDELTAMLAALRAEQQAALSALREREHIRIQRQQRIQLAWKIERRVTQKRHTGPALDRPRQRRRITKREKKPS